MMGPFLVLGTLGLGGTIVLYEGTPDFPVPDRLWDVCARHRVTHLGIAPTAIRSLLTHGDEHPRRHDLSALRILASSGELWNTEAYLWFLRVVGRDRCPIINYSGGTEIGGGIVSSFATMPLVPNCFHGPVPGMVADVVDERGMPVRGAVGELVIREPWPGMTQSFWGPDDERYLNSYWRRFGGVWVHGDWAEVDDAGYWFIRGRSDDTINVAGKRVGPAEFESLLAGDPAVREVATIAVPDSLKGDVPLCLVVVRAPELATEQLRDRLMRNVEQGLGKALAPKAIRFVDELPKTRNLKVMRRVARARFLGHADLGDVSALENPSALEAIDRHR
jgi:acetyl-CoA synthetase